MARLDALNMLYAKKKSIKDFNYDALTAPPMLSLLTPNDLYTIDMICNDPTMDSKLRERKNCIDQLLRPRGFVRFASGTNRVVYKFLEDQSFLLKVAISEPGIKDSYYEYKNQFHLKPFCAKCFETSQSGAVGLFERVETINNIYQYLDVADDHFKLLNDKIIGRYVMADVGSKFWMNLGIRVGFGVVFVDYPLLYELDGKKLFCNSKNPITNVPCGGQIDYDDGYNFLYCTKCGKQHLASRLAKNAYDDSIKFVKGKGKAKMIISVNGTKLETLSTADTYLDKKVNNKNKIKTGKFAVKEYDVTHIVDDAKEETHEEEIEEAVMNEAPQDIPNKVDENTAKDSEGELATSMEESTEQEKESVTVQQNTYVPKERLSAPFPIPVNILDNMEEDVEEENLTPKSKYDNY